MNVFEKRASGKGISLTIMDLDLGNSSLLEMVKIDRKLKNDDFIMKF